MRYLRRIDEDLCRSQATLVEDIPVPGHRAVTRPVRLFLHTDTFPGAKSNADARPADGHPHSDPSPHVDCDLDHRTDRLSHTDRNIHTTAHSSSYADADPGPYVYSDACADAYAHGDRDADASPDPYAHSDRDADASPDPYAHSDRHTGNAADTYPRAHVDARTNAPTGRRRMAGRVLCQSRSGGRAGAGAPRPGGRL
jgi:hypothetical protein